MRVENSHIENLHPTQRRKVHPESILTEGDYSGFMLKNIMPHDLKYVKYFGNHLNSDWTWETVQLYKQYLAKQSEIIDTFLDEDVKKEKIEMYKKTTDKKHKPIARSWRFTFGKYRGKTVDEVDKLNASYLIWCKDNLGMTFQK